MFDRCRAMLKASLSRLVKETAIAAVQVCLTLHFLFCFLCDRFRVLKTIRSFLPLGESETKHTLWPGQ
jgi:predicted PurR-regulated permease PerM